MKQGWGQGRSTARLGKRWEGAVRVAVACGALALAACSERALDTGVIGSVLGQPSPVSDNPSPIRGLSNEKEAYPNLGSVPPRPTDLRTEAQRQEDLDRLARDRDAAKKRLPTPADVPPPPVITPGKPG